MVVAALEYCGKIKSLPSIVKEGNDYSVPSGLPVLKVSSVMEIEKKYLVTSEDWKKNIQRSEKIVQFYLTEPGHHPTLRLRTKASKGYVTLKYPSKNKDILVREEFEYEIPLEDVLAQQRHAKGNIINKTRHYVLAPDQHIWEVDEFASPDPTLVLAEIELSNPDQAFNLPDWVGKDVTSDPEYSNLSLAFKKEK